MSRDSVDMQISRVISCIRCPSMTFPHLASLLACSSLYHSALCLSGGSVEKRLYFSFATSTSKQNSFSSAAISEKMVSLGILPYTISVFIASGHISFRITTRTLSPLTQISIWQYLSYTEHLALATVENTRFALFLGCIDMRLERPLQ